MSEEAVPSAARPRPTHPFVPFPSEDLELSIARRFERQLMLYPRRIAVRARDRQQSCDHVAAETATRNRIRIAPAATVLYKFSGGGFEMNITLRRSTGADTEAIARVVYEAFKHIDERHQFPYDFPSVEFARQFASGWNTHPAIWGVVAESDGQVVGVNFLNERNSIRGVGPIGVLPGVQGHKVGRRLMEAILERGRDADGIRLVQDSFNMGSLSLYASLGFEVKEPLVLMTGKPKGAPPTDIEVRSMTSDDLDACTRLCVKVNGFGRWNELRDALATFGPAVAVHDGRIVAYTSAPHFAILNHGVAESEEDLHALLLGTAALRPDPLALLVPTRRRGLFRWGLAHGLRAVKPMTLMALGEYQEPNGTYFPSVEY